MCTVTWIHSLAGTVGGLAAGGTASTVGGFDLFFNRDEARSRAPEQPPQEYEARGVRYLAPQDSAAGGTWISVNELGLALGLLNGYHASRGEVRPSYTSRGLLVRELSPLASPSQALAALAAERLERFQPFVLVAVGPAAPARLARWDGARLEQIEAADDLLPLSSSGFDQHAARTRRKSLWNAAREQRSRRPVESLLEFHTGAGVEPDATSVCMSRPEAETRSMVHISVGAEEVRMSHAAGRPDRTPLSPALGLRRRLPA